MGSMTDILNGDGFVWTKESKDALMQLLSALSYKVDELEKRVEQLEAEKNE
tara:strand:- start:611 stop:763 length:153 start_codon:yes stop_codon:yes gene_type:complete